jgi:hypothetical protein
MKLSCKSFLALAVLSSVLSACGGGGGGGAAPLPPPPPSTAEGLWTGSTNTGRALTALVLDDGSYFVFYSAVSSASVIAGALQGTGTALNGSFSSSDGKDFSLEGMGVQPIVISATYVARTSLNGTVTYTNPTRATSFTTMYDTSYDGMPTLAALAGTYTGVTGTSAGTEAAVVNIDMGGAVNAIASSGCVFRGTAAPRAHGNVYNISITFNAARCALPSATLTGIVYLDIVSKRLYAAAPNSARTDGVVFLGVRP